MYTKRNVWVYHFNHWWLHYSKSVFSSLGG